jgi:hypothetical protein
MTAECTREDDVLDAIASGWGLPRMDHDLRGHIASCGSCAELLQVATALLDERELAWNEASVPPSGVVWWRAQLRAREDAARAAARPLAFFQGVAASVALWLVVTLVRAIPAADAGAAWRWTSHAVSNLSIEWPDLTGLIAAAGSLPLSIMCLLAASMMLAPIAIYLAAGDE